MPQGSDARSSPVRAQERHELLLWLAAEDGRVRSLRASGLKKSPHLSPDVVMPAHRIGVHLGIARRHVGIAGDIHPEGGSTRRAMSDQHAPTGDSHEPGRYEIRLQGHLDRRWVAWFDGLSISHESGGTTLLDGPIADQAALHGLLLKVRDTGLPLVSVTQVQPLRGDVPVIEPA
jgi:hypothetical protein